MKIVDLEPAAAFCAFKVSTIKNAVSIVMQFYAVSQLLPICTLRTIKSTHNKGQTSFIN